MKWCWSRLPGGVVTWEAYELFKVGEIGTVTSTNSLWPGPFDHGQIHNSHEMLLRPSYQ
jgi:Domain of unknown function (DUF1708)